LQNWPLAKRHHQWFPLVMPLAIEQFDFSKFDLVISVSASFAKGIITGPNTKHVCFCLTPPRFLWDQSQKFGREFGYSAPVRMVMRPFISYLRIWDVQAAARPDEFWSISRYVGQRIHTYYHQPSVVIYPPVKVSNFHFAERLEDYFLMIGRLVSYKKFDVAITSFNRLGKKLKIVGTGPELQRLKKMAHKNIEFLGPVNDEQLSDLYANAAALVFPQEEDFGIVPLEAMASGRPVIAYRAGGVLETVVEGITGIFFNEQTPESLTACVQNFYPSRFSEAACRAQAEKFDTKVFAENVLAKLR
jgi:glycosyltransferase involved in cell wall biosynthesis